MNCFNCKKPTFRGYKFCYECNVNNKKTKTDKCNSCDNMVYSGYTFCYDCNKKNKNI
jgi:hypothetical protein